MGFLLGLIRSEIAIKKWLSQQVPVGGTILTINNFESWISSHPDLPKVSWMIINSHFRDIFFVMVVAVDRYRGSSQQIELYSN